MLRSKLLSPSARLKASEVQDSAHVKQGDRGDYVTLIHQALAATDNATVDTAETQDGYYGKSTAAAVLAFKTKRQIINRAYQSQPDNIVGKMTIKRLDDEMVEIESHSTEFFGGAMRNAVRRLT
jgi:peptidoglycan hydrolase-like protein with peptidoglycan-binding domain